MSPNMEFITIIGDWAGTDVRGGGPPCLLPVILGKELYSHQLQHPQG